MDDGRLFPTSYFSRITNDRGRQMNRRMLCKSGVLKWLLFCLILVICCCFYFFPVSKVENIDDTTSGNALIPAEQDKGFILIPDFNVHVSKSTQKTAKTTAKTTVNSTLEAKAPQHYVTVEFKGRLGNLLFEYASLVGIAKQNNLTLLIPENFELKKYFHISAKSKDYRGQSVSYNILFKEKWACAYDPATEKLQRNTNTKLKGYYQSWKYFENVKPMLIKELLFQDSILSEARSIFQKSINKHVSNITGEVTYIAVHVRRGDMVNSQHFLNYGYVSAGAAYLNTSMNAFRTNYSSCLFLVSSDDLNWCKQNLQDDDVVFMPSGHSAVLDMAILCQCNHTIMTVGSFGWWTAWFVNGTTTYWSGYPRPGSKLANETVRKEYTPPQWLPIP